MGFNLSTSMSLPIPQVGNERGPQYAFDVNNCLTIIDGHNHTPGSGVQVPVAGLNINGDLPMNANNIINLRSARFASQNSPLALATDLDCLYVSGVDLFYNDGNGNQIRITQSGGVVGSPGSISNLTSPASATYVSGDQTFVWQSAANTPANMDAAAYIFRNVVAGSHGITVQAPNSLSSDYTITLPALPASTLPLSISSSGNMSAAQITSAQIANGAVTTTQISASAGILGTQIAALTVTRANEAAVGQIISSSCGTFTTNTSGSYVAITNLTASYTSTGRPVMVFVQPDGSGSPAYARCQDGNHTYSALQIGLYNGSAYIGEWFYEFGPTVSSDPEGDATNYLNIGFMFMDTPAAGAHTYSLYVQTASGDLTVKNWKLGIYEL